MPTRRFLLWALALACLPSSPALAQKKVPKGVKATRSSCSPGVARKHHGYRDQAFYLATPLEDTGRYEVTLAEDAADPGDPRAEQVRPPDRQRRPPRPRVQVHRGQQQAPA